MPLAVAEDAEWLEADGLGGFASGTVAGMRTRRYHAILLAATTPPTGRFVLVNGFDAWLETAAGQFAISSQRYTPDVVHPDGLRRIESFELEPWPTWTFRGDDGTRIEHSLFVPRGRPLAVLTWRLLESPARTTLAVRPFLSGRDYHSLHHENPAFDFTARGSGDRTQWSPYGGVPSIIALTNGQYEHGPAWYRNFQYDEERRRGLDYAEDLASPGIFRWQLSAGGGEAVLIFAADRDTTRAADWATDADDTSDETGRLALSGGSALAVARRLREAERRRRSRFASRLARAADAYIVSRGRGKTIVAGYPWFTDWGRDTFIAMRGLCLATDRLDDARKMLVEWAAAVSDGMLPNRFADQGESPEFNAVDAALWYVVAVHEFLEAATSSRHTVTAADRDKLQTAVDAILTGYARGTRYRIQLDRDGLLAAGQPGVQLTWMDAKVGDWVVTPRIGKPVEVQALWLNALWIARRLSPGSSARWSDLYERGRTAFRSRFWNDAGGYLFDVVDVDQQPGTADPTFRPNQILAVGGLPVAIVEGDLARRVVDAVEARLWTPLGLRSLAPGSPGYTPRYEGGVLQRDGAYHQGTVWPWLVGAFVDAWVRVRGGTPEAKQAARRRFLEPLLEHLNVAGLGHVSEIADAEPPHTPRGCPFQAWSLGELIRAERALTV